METHPKHPEIDYNQQATRAEVKAQWTLWFMDTFDRSAKIQHVDEAVAFAGDCAEELIQKLEEAVLQLTGKRIK